MNEKQNTFRALKDEKPLVTSFLCRLGWHNWEQWGKVVTHQDGAYVHFNQTRSCADCKLGEIKTIKRI